TDSSTLSLHDALPISRLAKGPQARPDRAVRHLAWRELVAVVAAAARRVARLVVPGQAPAALREGLAALPVAHQAAFRVDDGFHRSEEHTSELQSRSDL